MKGSVKKDGSFSLNDFNQSICDLVMWLSPRIRKGMSIPSPVPYSYETARRWALKFGQAYLRVGFESHAARANLRTRSITEAA